MFWRQRPRRDDSDISNLDPGEIVSQVGEIYANFCEQHQLIKPRSSLPCAWFVARECFMDAYEQEYLQLSEQLKDGYQHVYRELSFFVDDDLYKRFNAALDVAAKCRWEREQKLGLSEDLASCRRDIASLAVKVQSKEEIWASLAHEATCPKQHLILITETLTYCSRLFHGMDAEWVAFANLVAYRKKLPTP